MMTFPTEWKNKIHVPTHQQFLVIKHLTFTTPHALFLFTPLFRHATEDAIQRDDVLDAASVQAQLVQD